MNKIRHFSKIYIYKLRINFIITFFVGFVFLSSFSQSYAGTVLKIEPDTQYNFAEYYFANQEYFRAIGEYKRFIYFFPEDARASLAAYKIGISYFKNRHFKKAVNAFEIIIEQYADTDLLVKSYFMISKCLVTLTEYIPAIANLHNLIVITNNIHTKDEAFYKIGWIYLEIGAWEKAKFYFSKISMQNSHKYSLKKLSDELNTEMILLKKNPRLAGFLSVIPGAGFLYCERYQDALIAFLLNGAMICAAYEAFDSENDVLGGIITFIETGFYAGNIYGSVSSAYKYNKNKTGQFLEKLKKNAKIKFSASYNNTGILLSFNYLF